MNIETIFKMRRKYLHECRALQKKEAEWLNQFYPHGVNLQYRGVTKTETPKMPVSKKEPDEFDPSQIFDNFTFIKLKL